MGSEPGGTNLQQMLCIGLAKKALMAFIPRATASPKGEKKSINHESD